MDVATETVLVAIEGTTAFVRILGRGSFRVSPAFKEFGEAAIEKGCTDFVVDMSECVGMDSTFMGVLAGLAMRLGRKGLGRIALNGVSPQVAALLETLGLDRLLDVRPAVPNASAGVAAIPKLSRLKAPYAGRTATAETMLSAHQDLVEVEPANLPRFQDVMAYLREEIRRAGDTDKGRT